MPDNEIFDVLIKNMKSYHPSQNFALVEKAYLFAKEAHGAQLRKSGEPYIIHPLSVAVILSEIELDRETIAAAILHDIAEDTDYTITDIARIFGEEIAHLVDGVTKLEKMEYRTIEEEQAENYRKMFLAMSNDIRVILIKIADRLHNLRTLKYMPRENQREKADETLDIYAPLAHRLGIAKIRYELEDLAFRYQNPDAYYELKDKIQRKQSERAEHVKKIVAEINGKLEENGVEAEVDGRPKHFFSIYKKMKQKDKTLDQIYDLFAVRVIVSTISDCYHVLGIVHEMYKPVPGRFKDYIAMPKPNMYQSIHNTLIGPGGDPFEIQIKTYEMFRISEYGIAAHWKYKEGDGTAQSSEEAKLSWLRQILEWQRDLSDNTEYLAALKFDLSLYRDHVYCFTPKGAVISLINGSTPIDFAFAIHSAVGNRMVGAKVNNRIVPIDHKLVTGDRVEILTSQNTKGPNRDWLKIVKTSQAKSKINAWFKREDRETNILKGREMLEKGAKRKNLTLSELLTPERAKIVLNRFSIVDWDSLCAVVGHGGIREGQVINRLYEEYVRQEGSLADDDEAAIKLISEEMEAIARRRPGKKSGIIVKGVGEISVRFSKCCSPVPGDEIVGFITRGRGVSVHRTDCVNMIHLDDLDRHRIIHAEWHLPDKAAPSFFQAGLKIMASNRSGLIADISKVLADDRINLESLHTRRVKDDVIIDISVSISSKEQLEKVINRLLRINDIHEITRFTA